MKTKSFILAAVCIALSSKVSAAFISLTASRDAVIATDAGIGSVATTNYGFLTYNSAWCDKSTVRGTNINRSLIDFNLSSIPVGATILSATLRLYGNGPAGSFPGHAQSFVTGNDWVIERLTSSWTESGVTWNIQPSSTSLNSSLIAGTTNPTQNYAVSITALVQDWVNNPSVSSGILLRLKNEVLTNAMIFGSKDNRSPDFRPRLDIEYSTICTGTVDLVADYDAAIGFHDGTSTASNNYGTAAQNAAYMVPSVMQTPGDNGNRALLHFDFSSLPVGSTITNALLDLFAYGPVGSYAGHNQSTTNGNASYLYEVNSAWTEMGVTWNTQPSINSGNFVSLAGTTNPTLDYLSIPVTGIVTANYTSANNYGMMLMLQNEVSTNMLIFCSEDHPTSSKHPLLHVTYQYDCGKGQGGGTGGRIASPNSVSNGKVATINEFFSIFPNPSKGDINLKYSLIDRTSGKVVIEDLQGRIVYEQDIKVLEHDAVVKDLSKGIYLCKLVTDGKVHSVEKLVISE